MCVMSPPLPGLGRSCSLVSSTAANATFLTASCDVPSLPCPPDASATECARDYPTLPTSLFKCGGTLSEVDCATKTRTVVPDVFGEGGTGTGTGAGTAVSYLDGDFGSKAFSTTILELLQVTTHPTSTQRACIRTTASVMQSVCSATC